MQRSPNSASRNHDDMEVEVPITAQGGAEALVTLTDRHKDIDAIFFSSDTLAVGAVQECHRRGWAVPGPHRASPATATWISPRSSSRR